MKVIFEGCLPMSYVQAYVEPVDSDADVTHENARAGQVNGLLGAAEPHALMLTTGAHSGDVGFRLVVADAAPEWEEVVEATFIRTAQRRGAVGR